MPHWLRVCLLAGVVLWWGSQAPPSRAAATLIADYQFGDSLESVTPGVPALALTGPADFVVDVPDGVERRTLAFAEGSGLAVALPADVLPAEAYTIVVLFRFERITSWRRIVDVKNGTSDSGLYSYHGQLQFYTHTPGEHVTVSEGVWVQVALTRDAGGMLIGYVDGVAQFSFADTSGEGVLGPERRLSFFRDDNGVPNEHSAGVVARIRIYAGALDAAEVAALDRLPG